MKVEAVKKSSNLVNVLFYSSESITALLFTVVSVPLIARHFGPDVLARYNVAQSVSAIFIVYATLGLDQFIIRELARNDQDAEYVTSTLIGLIGGWFLYAGLIIAYYSVFQNLECDVFLIASVTVSTLFLKVIFIKGFLQAQNRPKPIAIGSLLSRLLSVAYLVVGLQQDFSFDLMMLYLPLQAGVLLLVMVFASPDFSRLIKPRSFSLKRLKISTREASPIFGSTVLYYFYNQSDILIMSKLLDPANVGIYSASIRLIPQAAFIGFVLVAAFYKGMDDKLLDDKTEFESYVRSILSMQFGVGILMASAVYLTSDLIIQVLYGAHYAESGQVLAISCWAWVFIMPAILYSRLLVMLGYARYELLKMFIVAPLIIVLNYLVISRVGIIGCAYVFVFSYCLSGFLIYFLFKDTRYLGVIGLKALADIFIKPRQTFRTSISMLKARQ